MDNLELLKAGLVAHLARGNCAVFVARISDLTAVQPNLTTSEQVDFAKVRISDQHRCHILGRTLVRYFLGLPLADFDVGPNGKLLTAGVKFNISHTRDVIAIALHMEHPVGIDAEREDSNAGSKDLVAQVCHPAERAWINSHPDTAQETAFIRCWVRKESVLKATGTGLIDDLTTINTRPDGLMIPTGNRMLLHIWDIPLDFDGVQCSLAIDPSVQTVVLAHPAAGKGSFNCREIMRHD